MMLMAIGLDHGLNFDGGLGCSGGGQGDHGGDKGEGDGELHGWGDARVSYGVEKVVWG